MAPYYLQIVPRGPQSRFSHFLEISKNWPWPPMQGQIPHLEFFHEVWYENSSNHPKNYREYDILASFGQMSM